MIITIWLILSLLFGLSVGAGGATKDRGIIKFAIVTGIIWCLIGIYILYK
jgi:succinate-acetate transporter protein